MRSLRIAATLLLFRAAIRLFGVRRAMQLADRLASRAASRRDGSRADPERVIVTVNAVASKLPFRADCLPQSLTAWLALRRAGLEPAVRLGIALEGGPIAHAWVELDGVALGEANGERFHPFTLAPHLPPRVVGGAR